MSLFVVVQRLDGAIHNALVQWERMLDLQAGKNATCRDQRREAQNIHFAVASNYKDWIGGGSANALAEYG